VAHSGGRAGRAGEVECVVVGSVWNAAEVVAERGAEIAEALAARYAAEGRAVLGALRGSYAVVFYDRTNRRAVVAGDHFASYAVYYARAGEDVFFSSEPELLVNALPRRPRPDPLAVVATLGGGGVPGYTTWYAGVQRMALGVALQIDMDGVAESPYWRPEYAPPERISRAELVSGLWEHVEAAVARRLVRGGRTAVMMSAGVDSSTVVAAAARSRGAKDDVTGYAAAFPDYPHVDESERISTLADATGIPAAQLRIEPRGLLRVSLEFFEQWGTGLPYPGYLLEHETLRQAAAEGATALLDGQGGDETFGFFRYGPSELVRRGRLIDSWRAIGRAPGGYGRRWRVVWLTWRHTVLLGALPHAVHARLPGLGVAERPPSWLKTEHVRWYLDAADTWQWKRQSAPWAWSQMVDLLAGRRRGDYAEFLRRRAASAGLEARPPLLDVDLTEYVLRQPPDATFDPFVDRPLIREALLHLVPDSVRLHKQKSDISPFFFDALVADLEHIRRLLGDRDARALEFVDRSELARLLADQPAPGDRRAGGWMTTIWALTALEVWLRRAEDQRAIQEILGWNLTEPSSAVITRS
jgi:asparagine synthetase B (glutamine-hydrolysing)